VVFLRSKGVNLGENLQYFGEISNILETVSSKFLARFRQLLEVGYRGLHGLVVVISKGMPVD
jgi:hypothetical protein